MTFPEAIWNLRKKFNSSSLLNSSSYAFHFNESSKTLKKWEQGEETPKSDR